jgi:outer membrane lipoprotein SlyB
VIDLNVNVKRRNVPIQETIGETIGGVASGVASGVIGFYIGGPVGAVVGGAFTPLLAHIIETHVIDKLSTK